MKYITGSPAALMLRTPRKRLVVLLSLQTRLKGTVTSASYQNHFVDIGFLHHERRVPHQLASFVHYGK